MTGLVRVAISRRMAEHEATLRPIVDSLTIRTIGVEADADVRSVRRELHQPGSVRGRAGERVRAALARRGLQSPVFAQGCEGGRG